MKIVFVIQKLAARRGGAERIAIETANEMARRGHQVEIISHENRGASPAYNLINVTHKNLFDRPMSRSGKVRFKAWDRFNRALPHWPGVAQLKWLDRNRRFVSDLRRYLSQTRPDVVVPFLPPAMIATVKAIGDSGVPIVFSTHNAPERDYEDVRRWDPNPVDVRLRKEFLHKLARIFVLLPEYADWYPEQLQDRIEVVPNPVPTVDPKLIFGAQRENKLLFMGRLAEVKRPIFIIEAFRSIVEDFPDWTLEIYGDGPLREKVISHTATVKNVHYRGTTEAVSEAYLSAALLCHPAEYEGFPLSVTEALAHGLPVLGFQHASGVSALVKHDVNGWLVGGELANLDNWITQMRYLMSHPAKLRRMSEKAPQTVSQFTAEEIYSKWERILLDLA